MSSKKQKEKKKKDREKKVEEKVFKRREALRKERKTLEMQQRQEQEADNLVRGKLKPIVNDFKKVEEIKSNKEQNALSQLQKNLQILEALEKEYDREKALRNQINETLEAEGHMTMSEKMEALHQKALEFAKQKEIAEESENMQQEENL